MTSKLIRNYVVLDEESNELIKNAMDRLGLSARAYDRILKLPEPLLTWKVKKMCNLTIFLKLFIIEVWIGRIGEDEESWQLYPLSPVDFGSPGE